MLTRGTQIGFSGFASGWYSRYSRYVRSRNKEATADRLESIVQALHRGCPKCQQQLTGHGFAPEPPVDLSCRGRLGVGLRRFAVECLDIVHQKANRQRGGLPLDVWYFGRDPLLKQLPVRDLPLHCVPLARADDMKTYCWGRYLAIGASVRYGHTVSDSHRRALEFLQTREPTARTATFLIYDLTDIPPPQQATAPAKRVGS